MIYHSERNVKVRRYKHSMEEKDQKETNECLYTDKSINNQETESRFYSYF